MNSEFIFQTAPFAASHASTLVETGEGLRAAWFGGPHERHPEVVIWTARHNGEKWSAPAQVADGIQEDGTTRYPCWNPVLFQPKEGPLLLFFKVGPSPSAWWGMLMNSMDNGKTWSNSRDTTMNNTITNAGGTGKIGDREVFKVGSTVYEVVEAQIGPAGNYYDTWRLFLVNKTTSTAQQLNPLLAGGAKSLGNPTLTFVTLPNGKPALVFTYFIFSVNNGTTPPGGHIYVYPPQ